MTYHVPSGFSVESAPQPRNALWPDHAIFKIPIPRDSQIAKTCSAHCVQLHSAGSTDYPSLHDFYQKVATADQQQLVLTHATVAKGN